MEITLVLLTLFAALCFLFVICAVYLWIYKRHINKALAQPEKKHLRMVPPYRVLIALLLLMAIIGTSFAVSALPSLRQTNTAEEIEKEVRQTLDDNWNVEIAMGDHIAAVIAFHLSTGEHTFSIYQSRGAGSDYVFRYGGKSTAVERSVRVFQLEDTAAILSMNALHIAAIECGTARYAVDPDMPFALVIPSGSFRAYDQDGALLDLSQSQWYEVTSLPPEK